MLITWNTDVNAPCCPGEILADNGQSILIQTDWDYPGTAGTFGWNIASVQDATREGDFDYFADCGVRKCRECNGAFYPMETESHYSDELGYFLQCPECRGVTEDFLPCRHEYTDGTIDCKQCGCKASQFIESARQWLNDNDGATVDDPGYFND